MGNASDAVFEARCGNITVSLRVMSNGYKWLRWVFSTGRPDDISQLKEKGLVLGPFHKVLPNQPNTLDLQSIDPSLGKMEDVKFVLKNAHEKGTWSGEVFYFAVF